MYQTGCKNICCDTRDWSQSSLTRAMCKCCIYTRNICIWSTPKGKNLLPCGKGKNLLPCGKGKNLLPSGANSFLEKYRINPHIRRGFFPQKKPPKIQTRLIIEVFGHIGIFGKVRWCHVVTENADLRNR